MGPKLPKKLEEDLVIEDIDDDDKDIVEVQTPSGTTIGLLTQSEADFYNKIANDYQIDNKFKNISDKLELDRVLTLEVLCHRLGTWVMQDADYEGNPVPKDTQKNLQTLSREVRDIKNGLGIDKRTREAGSGENFADTYELIKRRAAEFGIHRNEQVIKAHTLWKELEGKVTLYNNSTPEERTEFEIHIENLLAWLDEKFKEFDEIDEAFRKSQKIWIRTDLND